MQNNLLYVKIFTLGQYFVEWTNEHVLKIFTKQNKTSIYLQIESVEMKTKLGD